MQTQMILETRFSALMLMHPWQASWKWRGSATLASRTPTHACKRSQVAATRPPMIAQPSAILVAPRVTAFALLVAQAAWTGTAGRAMRMMPPHMLYNVGVSFHHNRLRVNVHGQFS